LANDQECGAKPINTARNTKSPKDKMYSLEGVLNQRFHKAVITGIGEHEYQYLLPHWTVAGHKRNRSTI